jgi:hypothetical protein
VNCPSPHCPDFCWTISFELGGNLKCIRLHKASHQSHLLYAWMIERLSPRDVRSDRGRPALLPPNIVLPRYCKRQP